MAETAQHAGPFEKLLGESRDLVCAQLGAATAGMLDKSDEVLIALITESRDRDAQAAYQEARKVLGAQRSKLETEFQKFYLKEFRARGKIAGEAAQKFSELEASLMTGDPKGAGPFFLQALDRAEALDEPRALMWTGGGAAFVGDRRRSLRALDRAIALARERGVLGLLPHALGLRGNLAIWDGRLPEAGADADEAVRLADDIGAENARALPLTTLAWLKGLRGEEEECRRLVDDVLELATERGLALPAASATWSIAQLELAMGRWEEALVRLLALEELRPGFGHPLLPYMTTWDRVEAAVRLGRADVAERSIARFATWTEATAPAWTGVVLESCRALTAAPEDAEAHFQAAFARLDDARPLDRARAQLHYGEHLRRERRRIDARVHLREAVAAFERLGARPWVERAARELRATGETARKRDVSPLAELTPQELQVARLVGAGATNKAVAAQLFVSPKTVEYHLRKVFAKLGIASRSELFRLDLAEEEGVAA